MVCIDVNTVEWASRVPTTNYPKILGDTFDSMIKLYGENYSNLEQIEGAEKETLLTSYNAIDRSVFSYAAPVRSANTSATP